MLKTDFDGYLGFVEKVRKANADETKKLCKERTQMYVDKIQEVIAVTPSADLVFVITALRTITETVQKIDPQATHMAQRLFDSISYTSKSGTLNANMTEAAARAYADVFKKK